MKTSKILMVCMAAALLYSCGKNSSISMPDVKPPVNPGDTITYPGEVKYKQSASLAVDELVLYTSDGVNKDQQFIKAFIARRFPEYTNRFYYGVSSVPYNNSAANFSLLEGNKVKLHGTVMEIVNKTPTEWLVSPLDSANMPGPESTWLGRCMLLHDQIPQYNPYTICQSAGGGCKKYRKTYPIIISGKDYILPVLNYGVVSTCNIVFYKEPPMPNYFNKQVQNGLLQGNDSVVVQTGQLRFTL